MSLKSVRYTRLETEESEGDEDESPPTHVELNNESTYIKGSKWNHIDNLDEFFERVYEYQQKNGLAAIFLGDVLELIQFLFIVLFTAFLVTCLRWDNLRANGIAHMQGNISGERNVHFEDLFDLKGFQKMHPIVVLFLMMAFGFWIHRLSRGAIRLYRFWGIRNFYHDALHISSAELRNTQWQDVVLRLKKAQQEHKMNIQKQELTELDIYHRILRFKNYLVALVNKGVIQCKFQLPLYGEKVFFTQGLKFNYELILFWPILKAPFKNSFYLRDEYKSASKKQVLVQNLRFRITVLAFLNLIFCPVIFIYQLLYSFFSYAELLKNQPGIFGRRRWSLYGNWHLRDFNELEHEFTLRLCRAYKPAVKYMDMFADPLLTLLAKNLAFFAGSLLAVLLVLTIVQEQLLTTNNILTFITVLGLTITVCHMFIPSENQVWQPAGLMQRILGEIHYMPDHWKQQPHTLTVYREFTHVFQFTMMYVIDELLSPLITPFILYFHLRHKASDIVDFLRNFTIDVSGVGDVCSFAEMNVRKHGNPEWLSEGVTTAKQYDRAELGKTEISLMHFSRKNPAWKPSNDGEMFMSQLKESVDSLHHSYPGMSASCGGEKPASYGRNTSITYLTTHSQDDSIVPSFPRVMPHPQGSRDFPSQICSSDAMQWSIWSMKPDSQYRVLPDPTGSEYGGADMVGSTLDTLQIHQVHDFKKLSSSDGPINSMTTSDPTQHVSQPLNLPTTGPAHNVGSWPPTHMPPHDESVEVTGFEGKRRELKEPLLTTPSGPTEHAQTAVEIQDSFHSVGDFGDRSSGYLLRQHDAGQTRRGDGTDMTVVDLPTHTQ